MLLMAYQGRVLGWVTMPLLLATVAMAQDHLELIGLGHICHGKNHLLTGIRLSTRALRSGATACSTCRPEGIWTKSRRTQAA